MSALCTSATLRTLALGIGLLWAQASGAATKDVLGWVERVTLTDLGRDIKAKLDTGADTSSLHAENIERFRRNRERMVRFDVVDPETGGLIKLESPLSRNVRIREHDGEFQRRPVVWMWVCIGRHHRRIEVNLVDRSQFNYPLLLGRAALRGDIVVDPAETFTAKPSCDIADSTR